MKAIIYNQDNGQVACFAPNPELLKHYTIEQCAIKDVPAGKPFAIVDASELPQDIPQEAWAVDDADLTDGIGGESNEFN